MLNPHQLAAIISSLGQSAAPPPPTNDAASLMAAMMTTMAQSAQHSRRRPRHDESDSDDDPRPARRHRPDVIVPAQRVRELELALENKDGQIKKLAAELEDASDTYKEVMQERKEARTKCTKLEKANQALDKRVQELERQLARHVPDPPRVATDLPNRFAGEGSPSSSSSSAARPSLVPSHSYDEPYVHSLYADPESSEVSGCVVVTGGKVKDVLSVAPHAKIFMEMTPGVWRALHADGRTEFNPRWKLVVGMEAAKSQRGRHECVCCGSDSCRGQDRADRPCGGCMLKYVAGRGGVRVECSFLPAFDWKEIQPQQFRDDQRGAGDHVVKWSNQMSVLAACRNGYGEDKIGVKVSKGAQRRMSFLVRIASVGNADLAWAPGGSVPEALQWVVLMRFLRATWGENEHEITVVDAASTAGLRQEALWKGELTRAVEDFKDYYDRNMTGSHPSWQRIAPVAAAPMPRIHAPALSFAAAAAAAAGAVASPVVSGGAASPIAVSSGAAAAPAIARPVDVIQMPAQ